MDCKACGHAGCDGTECVDPAFVLTTDDGLLVSDCAICCREILAGERRGELREVAAVFRLLTYITAGRA